MFTTVIAAIFVFTVIIGACKHNILSLILERGGIMHSTVHHPYLWRLFPYTRWHVYRLWVQGHGFACCVLNKVSDIQRNATCYHDDSTYCACIITSFLRTGLLVGLRIPICNSFVIPGRQIRICDVCERQPQLLRLYDVGVSSFVSPVFAISAERVPGYWHHRISACVTSSWARPSWRGCMFN